MVRVDGKGDGALIRARGLDKSYRRGGEEIHVLQGLNLDGLDENDPESVSRFMKHMGHEMGEDVEQDVEAMMDSADSEASDDGSTDSQ